MQHEIELYLEGAASPNVPLEIDLLALGDGEAGAELRAAVHVDAAVLVHECVHGQLVDILRKFPRENYMHCVFCTIYCKGGPPFFSLDRKPLIRRLWVLYSATTNPQVS
jgi:hypothetical protein